MESERPNNKRQRVDTATSSPSSNESVDREKRPHSLSAVANGSNAQPLSRPPRKIHSYPSALDSHEEDNRQAHVQGQQSPYYHPPPQEPPLSDKKRLSIKHKNSLNLTIFAPSYHEQLNGIRSAPINSNFNKPTSAQQVQQNKSKHSKF